MVSGERTAKDTRSGRENRHAGLAKAWEVAFSESAIFFRRHTAVCAGLCCLSSELHRAGQETEYPCHAQLLKLPFASSLHWKLVVSRHQESVRFYAVGCHNG